LVRVMDTAPSDCPMVMVKCYVLYSSDEDISINDFIQNLDVSLWNEIKNSIRKTLQGLICYLV